MFAVDHMGMKNPSIGKFCSQTKIKKLGFRRVGSNMFGGEKVRPFTLNTQYLLTNMSVGVLSCGAVVAVSCCCFKESRMNDEESELSDYIKSRRFWSS